MSSVTPFPGYRLWPLPLIAGLLPLAATLIAFWISVSDQLIPACNPFTEGCVSISRAARHGLANHVFRALVLPGAALQGLTWILCAAWLRNLGAAGTSLRWLPWLGVIAGIFFILYGTFLGTEGNAYRWMRRYGIVVYFGFTYLCNLVAAGHLQALARTGWPKPPKRLVSALMALVVATLALGLAGTFVAPMIDSEDLKDRFENVIEWFGAAALTLFFLALAWLWRHSGFSTRIETSRGRETKPSAGADERP